MQRLQQPCTPLLKKLKFGNAMIKMSCFKQDFIVKNGIHQTENKKKQGKLITYYYRVLLYLIRNCFWNATRRYSWATSISYL